MKRSWKLAVALGAALSLVGSGPVAQGSHIGVGEGFQPGDVLVGTGSSTVRWYSSAGTLHQTMTTPVNSPSTTGMVFDLDGKLYATGFTSNGISRFTNTGSADGAFGSNYNAHPKSMAVDARGFLYVGLASGSKRILQMTTAGTVEKSYAVPVSGAGGADWIDLASDGCTFLYTNRSNAVRTFDACTGGSGFLVTGLPATAEEVRALVGGGALVATGNRIVRVTSPGIFQTIVGPTSGACWYNVALGTDGSTFWASDTCNSRVVEFHLEGPNAGSPTGKSINTGTRRNTVQGLEVFGGLRAATAGADLAVTKGAVTRDGGPSVVTSENTVIYRINVRNNGPKSTDGVELVDTLTGGGAIEAVVEEIPEGGNSQWDCPEPPGTTSFTCDLEILASGQQANTIRVRVRAPQVVEGEATITNVAEVSGDENDPRTNNNRSEVETTVLPPGNEVSNTCDENETCVTSIGGNDATPDNPFVADFTVPPGGPVQQIILRLITGEEAEGFCGGFRCRADTLLEIEEFEGTFPITNSPLVKMKIDASEFPDQTTPIQKVWILRPGEETPTEVPQCLRFGHALVLKPNDQGEMVETQGTCVHRSDILGNFDRQVQVFLIPEDPRLAGGAYYRRY